MFGIKLGFATLTVQLNFLFDQAGEKLQDFI